MENVTNANEMFFICKRLLKCEKIVSIDTVRIRWHLKTWCNLFYFHVKKPTSVYRRDKYTAVKEIYMRLHEKLRHWKKGKESALINLTTFCKSKKEMHFFAFFSECKKKLNNLENIGLKKRKKKLNLIENVTNANVLYLQMPFWTVKRSCPSTLCW